MNFSACTKTLHMSVTANRLEHRQNYVMAELPQGDRNMYNYG